MHTSALHRAWWVPNVVAGTGLHGVRKGSIGAFKGNTETFLLPPAAHIQIQKHRGNTVALEL